MFFLVDNNSHLVVPFVFVVYVNVQFKIGQHKKEIDELGSLCGYLEQKLVSSSN